MSPATTALLSAAADLRQDPNSGFAVAFPPRRSRVGEIRRRTACRLEAWEIPQQAAEEIVLAVSELVTNAVIHGEGTICLVVRLLDREVRVEVTDDSPQPARVTRAGPDDVSGRGMFLVAVLARYIEVSEDGYTTTAAFSLSGSQR
ncbi:ATP-binding protein [Streptomyces sp. CFMR 7]|uniref:ATP-binding protein n=1 Tax=Streptomyces sp. CFMR 7 TaxID=1649184 RepID=UPI0011A5F275|nr:ATP-binding protein [Streptomyces sp. CFMR 7]